MIQVDEDQYNDGGEKNEEEPGFQLQANDLKGGPERKRCENLNGRILPRDWAPARSAFAPQDQITQHRNIVERFDRLVAMRTVGIWEHNRLLVWQSCDSYVEEASNDQSKNNESQIEKHGRLELKQRKQKISGPHRIQARKTLV